MHPKEYAALKAPLILAGVLELEKKLWTCKHCGAKTTMLSEMCSGCDREDLSQGSEPLV